MTSILVVDDAPADREVLATILRQAGYDVLEADRGEQALQLARALQPDLIVADTLMPTMDGYELVRALRDNEATAGIPVIHVLIKPAELEQVLSAIEDAVSLEPDRVVALPSEEFQGGHLRLVNAKLLEKVEELRETVILAGTLQRESDQADGLGPWPPAPSRPNVESLLSRRELQVLGMIVDGATNREIAECLVIATSTVQSHVKRILHKLGVKNRTEAAVLYVRR